MPEPTVYLHMQKYKLSKIKEKIKILKYKL
jgi:hypothetical protein